MTILIKGIDDKQQLSQVVKDIDFKNLQKLARQIYLQRIKFRTKLFFQEMYQTIENEKKTLFLTQNDRLVCKIGFDIVIFIQYLQFKIGTKKFEFDLQEDNISPNQTKLIK